MLKSFSCCGAFETFLKLSLSLKLKLLGFYIHTEVFQRSLGDSEASWRGVQIPGFFTTEEVCMMAYHAM